MRRVSFFMLMATGCLAASAQVVKEHIVAIGISGNRLSDQFLLPAAVSGNALEAAYTFSKQSAARKRNFSAAWSGGSFTNSQAAAKVNSAALRFSQGYSLSKSGNSRLLHYVGYSFQTHPVFIKAGNKDQDRYSWSTTSDLSLYYSAAYSTQKTKWVLDIDIPLLGLASRPGEKTADQSALNRLLYDSYSQLFVTSLHNRQQVTINLGFRRNITERLQLGVNSRFDYMSLKSDYPYKETNIGLSGVIVFRLRQ